MSISSFIIPTYFYYVSLVKSENIINYKLDAYFQLELVFTITAL